MSYEPRTVWAGPNPYRCYVRRNGQFDLLGCCLDAGHEGPHNFVVLGVLPYEAKSGAPTKGRSTTRKGRVVKAPKPIKRRKSHEE